MTVPVECSVRPAKKDDLNFVIDSWMKSLRGYKPKAELRAGFWHGHRKVVGNTIRPGQSCIYVAHIPGSEDDLMGWVCATDGDPVEVHYLFVKSAYRKRGVGRVLIEKVIPPRHERHERGVIVMTITADWTRHYCRRRGWGIATHAPLYRLLTTEEERA